MIRIEKLSKHYGNVQALDGLSLQVETGSIYGFLGPNGAGKTTTLRILAGLARADSGEAWILDHKVGWGSREVRKLVGVLPEEPSFYPWMKAGEYLRDFTAPLFGLSDREADSRTKQVLDIVGLSRAANRKIAGFSRGMRQRLGLAQALIHQPRVLMLDEPVSALDPGGRKEILEAIGSLRGSTTVFFSTHILADVERVCDTIGIIRSGKMVVEDTRDSLLAHYAVPQLEVEADAADASWIERARHLPGIEHVRLENGVAKITASDAAQAQMELLGLLVTSNLLVRRFELVQPSLEDVFLQLTQDELS